MSCSVRRDKASQSTLAYLPNQITKKLTAEVEVPRIVAQRTAERQSMLFTAGVGKRDAQSYMPALNRSLKYECIANLWNPAAVGAR